MPKANARDATILMPYEMTRALVPSILAEVAGEAVKETSRGGFAASRMIDAGWAKYRRNVFVRVKPVDAESRITGTAAAQRTRDYRSAAFARALGSTFRAT